MSTAELNDSLIFDDTEVESAPLSGADFSLDGRPHLRLVGENYSPYPPKIIDVLLDKPLGETLETTSIVELKEYVKGLIDVKKDKHGRNKLAAYYGQNYHEELDIDEQDLTRDQCSNLVLARLYFSSLSSLGQLGLFIETNRWMGIKSPEAEAAKVRYLAARKVYQDDVDTYFEQFENEPEEILLDVLTDISNLARLTVGSQEFINAATDDHTHVFVGSVLSERLVKISMQEFIDPRVRYGDENEDKSPTKADVVWPRPTGDVYVQVKMKWTKPTNLKVQPKKKPPHVTIPLQSLRTDLTEDEHAKIAEIITDAAERQRHDREWEDACALKGLRKQIAICRIPIGELKSWWSETKQVVQEEKDSYNLALQTGVDAI
jgi:hypothetical protein